MPITLKSTGGGSVSIDVPVTGSTYTLTAPANNATIFTTAGGTITGNVAFTSNNVTIAGQAISPYGMMKNRIINGDFRIDQRFAGAANNNIVGPQYVVDRWYHGTSGAAGKLRFQQNNTNGPGSSATQTATGFSNYFGANTVSSNTVNAGDGWFLNHAVEGLNTSDLNWGTAIAAPTTLSFWVYSSISGTHGGMILNGNADRSYPFTFNVTTANTWQYQTITIPGDTTGSWWSNNNVGLYVVYSLGVGTTYNGTNNTWNSGYKTPTGAVQVVNNANGSFYLTGVQLEKGSQATAWDWRHYTTELQLSQRYYNKSYSIDVVPGTTTNDGLHRTVSAGGASYLNFAFPVEMRTKPTITAYNGSGTSGVHGSDVGNWSVGVTFTSTRSYHGAGTVTSGQWVYGHYVASAELGVQN